MSTKTNNGVLELSSMTLKADYCKEWNVDMNDFVVLSKNGELVNNSIYRIGGLNYPDLKKDQYFMLLKYVEAFYPADILKMSGSKNPKHLEGKWCIIDRHGNERIVFEPFKSPYLVKDSCIYSLDRKYYNIESGRFYCDASSSMESKDYLFLENRFDKDTSKRGIMKIHKWTGELEIFPIKD